MKYLATSPKSLIFKQAMIFLGFMNVGGQEVLFILLIVLLLFGAKKLPELARGMGSAIKEFQKAKDEFTDELHTAGKTDTPDVRSPTATVPRIESAPTAAAASEIQRDPDQAHVPGGKAGQV